MALCYTQKIQQTALPTQSTALRYFDMTVHLTCLQVFSQILGRRLHSLRLRGYRSNNHSTDFVEESALNSITSGTRTCCRINFCRLTVAIISHILYSKRLQNFSNFEFRKQRTRMYWCRISPTGEVSSSSPTACDGVSMWKGNSGSAYTVDLTL